MEGKKIDYQKKVDRAIKGASWEEAEEVGVEILARCVAKKVYVDEQKNDVFNVLFQKILKKVALRADQWAKENTGVLAMARVGKRMKETDGETAGNSNNK